MWNLDYLSGLLIAVLSAFIASVFTVINGRLTKTYDPYVITFYEMVGACLATTLFFPVLHRIFRRSASAESHA